MTDNENREYRQRGEHWLKTFAIILAVFIGSFLAFYFISDMRMNRLMSPEYQMRKMEKLIKQEQRDLRRIEEGFGDNPFEPKMAPMLVNLVKETGEYKVIVDLKPIGGSEKNINVKLADNVVTVSGKIEKQARQREEIIDFSQSYYLDEKVNADKMTKERKGNKYIITIPFEE